MTTQTPENGFLYIATGRKFIEEAKVSVASLKEKMPHASTCCFTDDVEAALPYFDQVFKIPNPYRNFFEKIPPLRLSPFKNTIFIDTDTYFTGDMSDVFDLLSRFEIAVVGDPFFCGFKEIPQCFTHLNTGLIAYRKSEALNAFFDAWFDDYESIYKQAKNKK